MLGYVLLALTFLFYIGLVALHLSEPSTGGDNAMGYGLGLAFVGLGLAISSLLVTIHIAGKGGFDWIPNQVFNRTLLVGLGWLMLIVASFACAVFRWEWHEDDFPQYLRWVSLQNAFVWLPLLMIVPYFFLLDSVSKMGVSAPVYQWPLMVGFTISSIICGGLLWGWAKTSAKEQAATVERQLNKDEQLRKQHLDFIASQQPTDPIVNILALTGRFHDDEVRNAAVAKVKSHPDWEAQLLQLLENDYYDTEVYTFMDGNKVEHPELFLQPLNRSILRLATKVRNHIKDSNDLQEWHFESYNIERLLRAIDGQFAEKSMDFLPAVVQLQTALKTTPPERFKGIRFVVTPIVDRWVKSHQK
ncbi:MAG: hypothetical protein R2822_05575 [Spirosomataceae bacterium]